MPFQVYCHTLEDTDNLAIALSKQLTTGDVILLYGSVGAGKTYLIRQIIQKYMMDFGQLEDVPSPTFTLIQSYELGPTEIIHADLYRLSSSDEIYELGLESAFESAICFIEWPDRLGPNKPVNALRIDISIVNDTERNFEFSWTNPKWAKKMRPLNALINSSKTT